MYKGCSIFGFRSGKREVIVLLHPETKEEMMSFEISESSSGVPMWLWLLERFAYSTLILSWYTFIFLGLLLYVLENWSYDDIIREYGGMLLLPVIPNTLSGIFVRRYRNKMRRRISPV